MAVKLFPRSVRMLRFSVWEAVAPQKRDCKTENFMIKCEKPIERW